MTKSEKIDWINNASYEQLLRKWRFEQPGDEFFSSDDDGVADVYRRQMEKKRRENPGAAVAASKRIGW